MRRRILISLSLVLVLSLDRAYGGFLKHYDAEMKAGRPEYQEHRTALDDFRKAALDAGGGRAPGS